MASRYLLVVRDARARRGLFNDAGTGDDCWRAGHLGATRRRSALLPAGANPSVTKSWWRTSSRDAHPPARVIDERVHRGESRET